MLKLALIAFANLIWFFPGPDPKPEIVCRWWVDRPQTKQDTLALVRTGYRQIRVFEQARTGPWWHYTWECQPVAVWELEHENDKIKSSRLISLTGHPRPWESLIKSTDKLHRYRDTLQETLGNKVTQFRLTHVPDSTGRVTKTVVKRIKSKDVCRLEGFSRIEYCYNNDGLLIEASYFGDDTLYGIDYEAVKYVFEYVK